MLQKVLPFFSWIKTYRKKDLAGDIPAGLTVGIMLIPQGMAYAMIAGLPPVYGLYAALVPQIIYAFMGTSRQLSVGPVAMDSLLVAGGLAVIAQAGSEHYILLAILLAFLMGAAQLLMGIFRLGFMVNYLSRPVISGFTSAAAIIIGLSQLKHLIGVPLEGSNKIHLLLLEVAGKLSFIHWPTLLMGLGGIVFIKLSKKFWPRVPASLVVVIMGIALLKIFGLDAYGVAIVGEIPGGLPQFSIPQGWAESKSLMPMALTLSLIAFMEAISVAKAIEEKHQYYKVDANQELIALGSSNLIASFFQCYPTTGGFSRSAVSNQAGARSGIASLIAAAVVAATLLFFTDLFYHLPKAVLASIILVAVFGLIDTALPKKLWRESREEFFLLLTTFLITLVVGITEGIVIGVIISLILVIRKHAKPHLVVLGRDRVSGLFRDLTYYPDAMLKEGLLMLRFDAPLFYGNKDYFRETMLAHIKEHGRVRTLVIDVKTMSSIDASARFMLSKMEAELKSKNIKLVLAEATSPLRKDLEGEDTRHILQSETLLQQFESFGENEPGSLR